MSNNLKERFESAMKNNREANKEQLDNLFKCENGKIVMPLSEKQSQLLREFESKREAMMQQGKTVVPTMAQEHGFSK